MKNYDFSTREGRAAFYRSSSWQILRNFMLSRNPLCERCLKRDRITPGSEIHHRVELVNYPEGRLDPSNLEVLCQECHNKHSALESSGSEKDLQLINREWKADITEFNKKP
jgi:5-methylcytosine-specific restriction protein A